MIEVESEDFMKYDFIVVGSGFAGATIAERIANELDKKVLVIDKRDTIGGNMYDYIDENGILVHKYGPHLFHTNLDRVYNYLKGFGDWFKYEHRVLGKVNNKIVPIPFNITSIEKSFDKEKAEKLIEILTKEFGIDKKIPILELRKHPDRDINELAEYIYKNVFLYYTMKQWGQTPDEIDPNVTNRVPVFISKDDRYFQDKYQFMPVGGYTKIFEKMLESKNIEVRLGVDANNVLKIKNNEVYFEGEKFKGSVIYTGPIDEFFDYEFGALPYRSLQFEFETINKECFQPVGTVNYPTKEDKFTRITEFKHMTMENAKTPKTTIMREYPCAYDKDNAKANIPYYPIVSDENMALYNKYLDKTAQIPNFYLIGRLAQYKYFNMDLVINEALKLFDQIKEGNNG